MADGAISVCEQKHQLHLWHSDVITGYWTVGGSNISAWAVGSTLLAFGLSPQQAIGVVVSHQHQHPAFTITSSLHEDQIIGGVLTGLLAVACGWMGEKHHIGFTVSSRFSWGMRGSYFPVVLRNFMACMWFGMQAYWGGQSTRVLWGAIIPGKQDLAILIFSFIELTCCLNQGFAHMKNYFSESSHLATNDFIGLLIWFAAFLPLILVRPERLQIPFAMSFVLFASSCIGILIW